jgi:hypothetical protein
MRVRGICLKVSVLVLNDVHNPEFKTKHALFTLTCSHMVSGGWKIRVCARARCVCLCVRVRVRPFCVVLVILNDVYDPDREFKSKHAPIIDPARNNTAADRPCVCIARVEAVCLVCAA